MNLESFKNCIWNHYLYIEREFIKTGYYVSFSKKNFKTFSDVYFSLLQLIGSEIDVVLKEICYCFIIPKANKMKNINNYCEIIISNIPNFTCEAVSFLPLQLALVPWDNWCYSKNKTKAFSKECYKYSGNSPKWWQVYNKTKHNRVSSNQGGMNFELANLENVLYSLAALYLSELELYSLLLLRSENESNMFITPSRIFELGQSSTLPIFKDCSKTMNNVTIPFVIR